MMSSVTCPACQHKQLLPEGEMGKLQNCPNCQSSFVAGTSTVEARGMLSRAAGSQQQPSYAKTMLAAAGAPPIKYNCPRCKAPLEAPASEGGAKSNCPHCSQRLQVPAAPVSAAPAPGLNKTMLAGDDFSAPPPPPIKYNCPNCKKPLVAPAAEAGTKKNCTHCSQRLQVPAAAAAGLNKTKLASADDNGAWPAPGVAPATGAGGGPPPTPGGREQSGPRPWSDLQLTPRNVAIGVAVLLLLVFVVPAVLSGGKRMDAEAAAKAQFELEKLKAEIEQKKNEMERQKNAEAETRRQFDDMMNRMRAQDEKMRSEHLALVRSIGDQNKKTELEEKFNAAQRKLEEEKREMETKQQQALEDAKRRLEESKRALDASQQRQQTIIHQPPPVMYYPPYHHRYYWPW